VTFGGSTAAGTKALLELNKINPDKAIALNTRPKRKPSEYMDLRFANEVMAELGQK
jgi:hypothetical protein